MKFTNVHVLVFVHQTKTKHLVKCHKCLFFGGGEGGDNNNIIFKGKDVETKYEYINKKCCTFFFIGDGLIF